MLGFGWRSALGTAEETPMDLEAAVCLITSLHHSARSEENPKIFVCCGIQRWFLYFGMVIEVPGKGLQRGQLLCSVASLL